MPKKHFKLQASESVIVQSASQIYAAYISAGRVGDDDQARWMKRAIGEAISIARGVDETVISDDEVDSNEGASSSWISMGRVAGPQGRHQS